MEIPFNCLPYINSLSRALATSAPHLTLEFLKEWTIAFSRSDPIQKSASSLYVAPWLSNLEIFARPSRDDGEANTKVVEEIIRSLVGITVVENRVCSFLLSSKNRSTDVRRRD